MIKITGHAQHSYTNNMNFSSHAAVKCRGFGHGQGFYDLVSGHGILICKLCKAMNVKAVGKAGKKKL